MDRSPPRYTTENRHRQMIDRMIREVYGFIEPEPPKASASQRDRPSKRRKYLDKTED